MEKKRKTALFLTIILVFLFSGIAMSDETKVDKKSDLTDKAQIEKMLKKKSGPVFHWTDKKFSMKVIRPNPNIDSEIVKNTYDPNIDYKLRIIDPYTRKEITGYKGLCPGSFRHKFLPKGKRYETPLTSPSK